MTDTFTAEQQRILERLQAAVERRAQAVRDEAEATRDIAMICIDARNAGVVMRVLADTVKVLEGAGTDNESLRSVTRQSLDQLLAKTEGRKRAPRKKSSSPANGKPAAAKKTSSAKKRASSSKKSGGVNAAALLGG